MYYSMVEQTHESSNYSSDSWYYSCPPSTYLGNTKHWRVKLRNKVCPLSTNMQSRLGAHMVLLYLRYTWLNSPVTLIKLFNLQLYFTCSTPNSRSRMSFSETAGWNQHQTIGFMKMSISHLGLSWTWVYTGKGGGGAQWSVLKKNAQTKELTKSNIIYG